MSGHDIVVVGFSAGGIDPLLQMVADLPRDFPAAMFVVHHFPAQSISALPRILSRSTKLPVAQAVDEDEITPGHIYVARPDQHLLLRQKVVRLTRGPREHGHRPAVDPLFRTAARYFGPRVVGVILSGSLDDGTAGLHAIKAAGGMAVVQDPEHCTYPGMPASAIAYVDVDCVVRPEALGEVVNRLAREPAAEAPRRVPRAEEIDPADVEPAFVGTAALRDKDPPGRPSPMSCPDCGGVLWESEDGKLLHFRCHVGHAFSEETLLAKQSDALETALWSALRALEEKADLSRRLADRIRRRGGASRSAAQLEERARDAEHGSNLIRASLLTGPAGRAIEGPEEPAVGEEEALSKAEPG
ncbi:MAG: chemotaxis protein CheB [Gemmatimonadales bacterium]